MTSSLPNLFSLGWRRFALACLLAMVALGSWMVLDRQTKLSARSILEEAEIKKLRWQHQPGKIVHWELQEYVENSPNFPSGHYISKRWNNNLNGQRSELILRYDQHGELVWGRWIRSDATEIVFDRRKGDQIIVYPGLPLIKQDLAKLSDEEKIAMHEHIAIAERVVDLDQVAKSSVALFFYGRSEEKVTTHESENSGKVLCVNLKSDDKMPRQGVTGFQTEHEFDETTLQQVRFQRNYFLNNGSAWTEEFRLLSFGESTLEEFENNELARRMADSKNVKYISVGEFARELLSLSKRADSTQ